MRCKSLCFVLFNPLNQVRAMLHYDGIIRKQKRLRSSLLDVIFIGLELANTRSKTLLAKTFETKSPFVKKNLTNFTLLGNTPSFPPSSLEV